MCERHGKLWQSCMIFDFLSLSLAFPCMLRRRVREATLGSSCLQDARTRISVVFQELPGRGRPSFRRCPCGCGPPENLAIHIMSPEWTGTPGLATSPHNISCGAGARIWATPRAWLHYVAQEAFQDDHRSAFPGGPSQSETVPDIADAGPKLADPKPSVGRSWPMSNPRWSKLR